MNGGLIVPRKMFLAGPGRYRWPVVSVGAAAVALTLSSASPLVALETRSLQHVAVELGADSSVKSVSVSGSTSSSASPVQEVAPAQAVEKLPIRVQTLWWHDGKSGTDLSELQGKSGRFVMQLVVQDVTSTPTEIAFDSNGARFHQKSLVGVPLTVVANAIVPNGRVVSAADAQEGRVTDGVVVSHDTQAATVQWASLIAPPVLAPTSTFTLVVESEKFAVPEFNLAVEPGITTDPSMTRLVERAFGTDGAAARQEQKTISHVLQISKEVNEALQFVDETYLALQDDISTLGAQTFTELKSSSESIIRHLESTRSSLTSIGTQTSSAISSTRTGAESNLTNYVSSIDSLLGGGKPQFTGQQIEGCSIALPQLAAGEPRTIMSSIYLVDAQLGAVTALFGKDNESPNCRTKFVSELANTIGSSIDYTDPSKAKACLETKPEEASVSCRLHQLSTGMEDNLQQLHTLSGQAEGRYSALSAPQINDLVTGDEGLNRHLEVLAAKINEFKQLADDTSAPDPGWISQARAQVNDIIETVKSLDEDATKLQGQATALKKQLTDSLFAPDTGLLAQLEKAAAAGQSTPSVGAWFADSGYRDALGNLVDTAVAGGQTCDATWGQSLTAESTATDIAAALTRLETADCSLSGVAAATRQLVEGYSTSDTALTELAGQVQTSIDKLKELRDSLPAKADELVATTGELSGGLRKLYQEQNGTATGKLAELQKQLDGSQGKLSTSGKELKAALERLWDGPVELPAPDPDEGQCARKPLPDGESIATKLAYLSDSLKCNGAELSQSLTDLNSRLEGLETAVPGDISAAQGHATEAVNRLNGHLDALGTQLDETVATQRSASLAETQTTLQSAREKSRADLQSTLEQLEASTNGVLETLSSALDSASAQSQAVADQLHGDFERLLANLGQPRNESRLGVLGKLYGVTTQVGETGNVLQNVDSRVRQYGSSRTAQLLSIDMQSAVFSKTAEATDAYQPFADRGRTGKGRVLTVFTYTLKGSK
ncbi:hypothetical protein EII12_03400 [Buchananella hordeovulneris]|uniref:hypothetical protein n=1 Tax=Buchananella hordeovulneris TaxID=52770 RepID=UPI000F5F4A2F|nr:hypothetical protein [Buchananella hordeovulneris]RRD52933.1 hypothetical protein EII12_03400 [Buchananella hordeovulneris]